MALMFPRLARNFAKNGYFPTDEPTLERILNALAPSSGPMCIIDPCGGEGVAIAEVAHALGRENVNAYVVEYNDERAAHAKRLVDHCLHGDLNDTLISPQAFGLAWLNSPYGDLVNDQAGRHEFKGRARLEKVFYQRTLPLLAYGAIMVFIIPSYILDDELIGWLTRNLEDVRIFRAIERQFKQVVILGRRIRQRDQNSEKIRAVRALLSKIGRGDVEAEDFPSAWPFPPYSIPSTSGPEHFYRISLEPAQLASEVHRLQGLWPMIDTHLGAAQQVPRPPARALSHWHLALALAAGAISGVVRSRSGRTFVVKGDTHKDKSSKTDYTANEDGSVTETVTLTDRFVPSILAWDMTPGSETQGQVFTIR